MKEKKGLGRHLIRLAALAMFLFAAWQLLGDLQEDAVSSQQTVKLQQAVAVATQPPAPPETVPEAPAPEQTLPEETEPRETAPISVDFSQLQQENQDIVAWIYCPDTKINYPIAQGPDNDYYLHRLTDGSYNANGTLFLDYKNDGDLGDLNSLVYGHNMSSDAMFGGLDNFRRQDYYDSHSRMWILTPEKAYRMDLLAGVVTSSDSADYIFFYDDENQALQDHVDSLMARSVFQAERPETVERIVTLSTCSYEFPTARFILAGSLTEVDFPE